MRKGVPAHSVFIAIATGEPGDGPVTHAGENRFPAAQRQTQGQEQAHTRLAATEMTRREVLDGVDTGIDTSIARR